MKQNQWHVAKTGNDQGLVIDESGENIAVTYREEDAALVASAPELLDALKELYRVLREDEHYMPYNPKMQQAHDAIAKATKET